MYCVGRGIFPVEPELIFRVCHLKPVMSWQPAGCVSFVPIVLKSCSLPGYQSPGVFNTHSDLDKNQHIF